MNHIGYIGTYNSNNSHGIYQFTFDDTDGKLSTPSLFYKVQDGKCVCLSNNHVIITKEGNGKAGIALLDFNANLLAEILTENTTPCYIGCHSNMVYTANFHDGCIIIYQIINNKLHLVKRLDSQKESGCHQALLWQNMLFIPYLHLDKVDIYDTTNTFQLLSSLTFPKGTGPRHCIFTSDNKRMYLVSELSNQLFYYHLQNDNFWQLQKTISFLPTVAPNSTSAAIRLSTDENYIYISTRGSDLLTIFSIKNKVPVVIQQIPSGGCHPRDFILSPCGNYLLVVNRSSNELISMSVNKSTGLITSIVNKVPVYEGIGIAIN